MVACHAIRSSRAEAYARVLVGGDGDELRLLEADAEVLPREQRERQQREFAHRHEVQPRHVLVHRVQHRLQSSTHQYNRIHH